MAGPELTPELLAQLESHVAFWETLTVNRGEGALFGHGGQLNGFFHHFEFLADVLSALLAAAKERDQLRAEVERLRGLGLGACDWLESTSDKAARRFHAAHVRAEMERKP